jgi:hypothetical protein
MHTSAYVSIRRSCETPRLRAPAYVSIRQHTSACVSIRQYTPAYVSIRQHTWEVRGVSPASAGGEVPKELIRQHASAYVSIRQHTSAYVGGASRLACERRRRSAQRAPALCDPSRMESSERRHPAAECEQATPLSSRLHQHTSAYAAGWSVSRPLLYRHACISIRQHTRPDGGV